MTEPEIGDLYGPGSRSLQDDFDSRRLADRLVELTIHDELTEHDTALIEAQRTVLVATTDAAGWPDVSYKGGDVGFVRVIDPRTLIWPSYDGNGMFRTLGNIVDDPRLAMLFVDTTLPWRLRLHGTGEVLTSGPLVDRYHEAQAVVRVTIARLFPNCGRYVHTGDENSPYVPQEGVPTPEPEWKAREQIAPYLPGTDTPS